jgi:hypothetical protein
VPLTSVDDLCLFFLSSSCLSLLFVVFFVFFAAAELFFFFFFFAAMCESLSLSLSLLEGLKKEVSSCVIYQHALSSNESAICERLYGALCVCVLSAIARAWVVRLVKCKLSFFPRCFTFSLSLSLDDDDDK